MVCFLTFEDTEPAELVYVMGYTECSREILPRARSTFPHHPLWFQTLKLNYYFWLFQEPFEKVLFKEPGTAYVSPLAHIASSRKCTVQYSTVVQTAYRVSSHTARRLFLARQHQPPPKDFAWLFDQWKLSIVCYSLRQKTLINWRPVILRRGFSSSHHAAPRHSSSCASRYYSLSFIRLPSFYSQRLQLARGQEILRAPKTLQAREISRYKWVVFGKLPWVVLTLLMTVTSGNRLSGNTSWYPFPYI
ncbi:hypothetical protein BJV78DRAFT_113756 [Lactifluus subvellereus]|nr:hypothetical protein BJV78DRAFT_113756 [Lactifluus subvellereus]